MCLAEAWHVLAAGLPSRDAKVWSAVWCARGHSRKVVTGAADDPEPWRTFSGLYSGDRDTSRDNTLLHGVYSTMAMEYTRHFDPHADFVARNYTGDDEDVLLNDWATALIYFSMHSLMGFVLKPAKQMCSKAIHEFLAIAAEHITQFTLRLNFEY